MKNDQLIVHVWDQPHKNLTPRGGVTFHYLFNFWFWFLTSITMYPTYLCHAVYSPFIHTICLTHYMWHYVTAAQRACRRNALSCYRSLELSSASLSFFFFVFFRLNGELLRHGQVCRNVRSKSDEWATFLWLHCLNSNTFAFIVRSWGIWGLAHVFLNAVVSFRCSI